MTNHEASKTTGKTKPSTSSTERAGRRTPVRRRAVGTGGAAGIAEVSAAARWLVRVIT